MLSVVMLSVIMLSVVVLNVFMLSVVMLSVVVLYDVMLSAIVLYDVRLNVVAPVFVLKWEKTGAKFSLLKEWFQLGTNAAKIPHQ